MRCTTASSAQVLPWWVIAEGVRVVGRSCCHSSGTGKARSESAWFVIWTGRGIRGARAPRPREAWPGGGFGRGSCCRPVSRLQDGDPIAASCATAPSGVRGKPVGTSAGPSRDADGTWIVGAGRSAGPAGRAYSAATSAMGSAAIPSRQAAECRPLCAEPRSWSSPVTAARQERPTGPARRPAKARHRRARHPWGVAVEAANSGWGRGAWASASRRWLPAAGADAAAAEHAVHQAGQYQVGHRADEHHHDADHPHLGRVRHRKQPAGDDGPIATTMATTNKIPTPHRT